MVDFIARYWPLVIQIAFGFSLLGIVWIYLSLMWGAPWLATPPRVVKKMLRMANVQSGQKVVDLGAGDGRIVIAAARSFKAKAAGVEIDPIRCLIANMLILLLGLRGRARVYCGDMFDFDVSDADVVTLYLWPGTNRRLEARLASQMCAGARVVSYTFSMIDWMPVAVDDREKIYLYEIGNIGMDVQTLY